MLHCIYGTNSEKRLAAIDKIAKGLSVERFDEEHFSPGALLEVAESAGLFGDTKVFLLKDLLSGEHEKFILKNLKTFSSSPHIFIIVEEKVDKKTLESFKKAEASILEVEEEVTKKEFEYNVFSLSDLLGQKDRKRVWIEYQKALRSGVSAEEVHGILFWQVKNLLLVQNSGENPGLHPFVFQKTQGFLKKFSKQELVSLSSQLVTLFHESRRVDVPLEIGLERFLLGALK